MRCWMVIILFLSTFGMKGAAADLQTARIVVPDTELVGQERLKVLSWNVFDASDGTWSRNEPFVLSVSYLRNLQYERIVDTLISEIRYQGVEDETKLTRWLGAMSTTLSGVNDETTVTVTVDNERQAIFFGNEEMVGAIRDPVVSKCFFDIWLGEQMSQPELHDKLLNETS